MITMLLAAAAFVAPATASATATTAADKPAAQATKSTAKDTRRYCIELDPLVGSRARAKECKTKEQWAREGVDIDAPQS